MARHLCAIVMLWLVASMACAQTAEDMASTKTHGTSEVSWLTDLEAAKAQAARENKPILVNFSGSDWCYWCKKLDQEVFEKPVFEEYVAQTFVPVVLDFPRKNPLPPEQSRKNREAARNYGVQGFPTILLLNAEGKVLAKTGYQPGGAQNYVNHLKDLMSQ